MDSFPNQPAPASARLRQNRIEPFAVATLADSGYQVVRKIGSGGMGIVYLVRDEENRQYALKVLRPDISDDASAKERLRREVQTLQKLRSENVAQVLDFEFEGDSAFVVTEFVPGPTLDEAVKNFGPLHLEVVRELGVILGEALQEIHALGIVHRDLKPSNVMLRHARSSDLRDFDADASPLEPVLIDFGISLAAEDSRITSTGLVMGTAAYLDPAVVRTNETTAQADWWAWAALLAYAATGRDPFGTGRFDLVFLRAERGEVDLAGLPEPLQDFLRSALNPEPALRPQPQAMLETLALLDFSAQAQRTELLPAGDLDGGSGLGAEEDFAPTEVYEQRDYAQFESEDTAPTELVETSALTEGTAGFAEDFMENFAQERFTTEDQVTEWFEPERFAGDSEAEELRKTQVLPVSELNETRIIPRTAAEIPAVDKVPTETKPLVGNALTAGSSLPADNGFPAENIFSPGNSVPPSSQFAPENTLPGNSTLSSAPPLPLDAPPAAFNPMPNSAGGYLQPPEFRQAPKHPWLVFASSLVLIALGALAPVAALLITIALIAAARTWQRAWISKTRSQEQGVSLAAANTKIGFTAVPWLLWSAVEAVLMVILPVTFTVAFLLGIDAVLVWTGTAVPPFALYGAIILALALLNYRWGFGSRLSRNGVNRILDASAPEPLWSFALFSLLMVLFLAICYLVYSRSGTVDYFPIFNQQPLENWLPWR